MLFQRRYRPLIGLDITTSSIKLIELTRIRRHVSRRVVRGRAVAGQCHQRKSHRRCTGRRRCRAPRFETCRRAQQGVAVAVSGDAAITKVIQMPRNLRESELESQVEMQADQYIPFPMEEVSFDFEVVGPSEKDPK